MKPQNPQNPQDEIEKGWDANDYYNKLQIGDIIEASNVGTLVIGKVITKRPISIDIEVEGYSDIISPRKTRRTLRLNYGDIRKLFTREDNPEYYL